MTITPYLREQMRLHPAMQPQDVLKLCYQAVHGAEHLLTDPDRARAYFDQEYASVTADASVPLAEDISDGITRINIAGWKAAALPADWLFHMFVRTANAPAADAPMAAVLAEAAALCRHMPGWDETLAEWRDAGMPAIHHSDAYRAAERPAYRIIRREYRALLPALKALAAQPALHPADAPALLTDVLGITTDGQCGVST